MMSSKTLRYMLIGGTLFIWGTIAYKVIAGLSDSSAPPVKTMVSVAPIEDVKQENYYLFANYPDPFIEEESDSIIRQIPIAATVSAPPSDPLPVAPAKPDLSFVQYHGCISNRDKKLKIALVSFKGAEVLIKEKDRRDEVFFKKIYPDRIDILYKGKSFTIHKN